MVRNSSTDFLETMASMEQLKELFAATTSVDNKTRRQGEWKFESWQNNNITLVHSFGTRQWLEDSGDSDIFLVVENRVQSTNLEQSFDNRINVDDLLTPCLGEDGLHYNAIGILLLFGKDFCDSSWPWNKAYLTRARHVVRLLSRTSWRADVTHFASTGFSSSLRGLVHKFLFDHFLNKHLPSISYI